MSNNHTTASKNFLDKFHSVLELRTAKQRAAIIAYLNRIGHDDQIDDDELRVTLVKLKQEDRDRVRAYLDRVEDKNDGVEIELKEVLECMRATHRDETKSHLEKI